MKFKYIAPMIFLSTQLAWADIGKTQKQLQKIESSIEITRKKIRSTNEVTFVPDLQFVLAELLLQKARLMYIVKKEKATGKKLDEIDFAAEKRQVVEGIEQLRLIESKYPNFHDIDKVLLTMGLELRKIGDQEKSLQAFKKLSERGSSALYTGRALLEIGNIFFDKKDYEFALAQYKKVTEMADNPSKMQAAYKAGWAEINLEHFLPAMLQFEKIFDGPAEVASNEDNEGENKKTDLREDALIASVWPYSELSEKETAENPRFLKPIDYYENKTQDKIVFRRTLKRLAQRLDFKKRTREGSEAAERAFLVQSDLEESLELMESVFTLYTKAKRRDVSSDVLDKIAENLYLLKERNRSQDLAKYEPHFRQMLTRSHAFALSIKRVEDLRALVNGYETYLKVYPQSKNFTALLINQSEAAFVGQDYLRAASLYLKVTSLKIPSEKTKEFYDSASQAYVSALKNPDALTLMEKTQAYAGYRNLIALYEKKFPNDPNLDPMKYNNAKNYYDGQSYGEAVTAFRDYIKRYNHSAHTEAAAILLMDSFYLQDDLKGLLAEGSRMMSSAIEPGIKSKLSQVMQEAKLKQVQSVAGEFATRKYADKFLEVAKQSKNSAIGEAALLEAFNSLRAGEDVKLYQVGEEYFARFPRSAHAKDVLNQMIKLAIVTLDFERAADYMQAYSHEFPDDQQSSNYKAQTQVLLEMTGQADKIIETNIQNKNELRAVQLATQFGMWDKVQQISAALPGGTGLYYQGLAFWRQGKVAEGAALLQRTLSETTAPATPEMMAHAGVILAENQIRDLAALEKETFSVPVMQKILEFSKNANQTLQEVVSRGSGRWSVASLAMIGRLNSEIGRVLSAAAPPAGLPVEAFKKIVDPKVADYRKAGKDAFVRCLDLVQKESIPSDYVRMCRGGSVVTEAMVTRPSPTGKRPAVTMNTEIRNQLLKTPKSMEALTAALKLNGQDANPYGVYAVASRMTEVDPAVSLGWSALGEAALRLNHTDEAMIAFRECLKKDPNDKRARQGLARMLNMTDNRLPATNTNEGNHK